MDLVIWKYSLYTSYTCSMALDAWQQNFVQHNLMKTIATNLIWRFQDAQEEYSAMLHQGQLVRANGSLLPQLSVKTTVCLWHPLHCGDQERDAWRNFIWQHSIEQPIRQAYREIYQPSEIEDINELVSGLYLRQHQFRALLLDRGWRYQLRGNFESESAPRLQFSDGLSCEIGIGAQSETMSSRTIALAVELTEIRFMRDAREISSAEISPILCSEVLRDIDLFVSVAGVGYRRDWEETESVFAELVDMQIDQALDGSKSGATAILAGLLEQKPSLTVLAELLLRIEAAVDAKPVTGVVKMRRDLLSRLLDQTSLERCTRLEPRNVFVDGPDGQYRINLASGLIFNCADNSLIGSVEKERSARLNGEAGNDVLLAKIYSGVRRLAESTTT
ncbi:MAG: DUF4132 domain-containing protein [Gammaproteobacteria bacterium]|nr:DUF4132 domain-containing protein [Gammaproteobacteria bacterium]